MKRVWSQCLKELAQFRRDRLTLALAFVLPLVAVVLYGYAIRLESKNIPLAVCDFDGGPLSREYVSVFFANNQFTPVRWQGHGAFGPLDFGVAMATLTIPPEFSRRIKAGLQAPVQVVIDATDVNNARVIKNSILATTTFFLQSRGLVKDRTLIRPAMRIWFNPGRQESLYVAPGALAVLLWVFPCLLAALAMSREKEQGTMLQLYASSLTSYELVAGKALAYAIIALCQSVVMTALAVILFRMHFVGDLALYLVSLGIYLFCAVLFGIMIGARANSQSAAVQIVAPIGFTTALLLSGFLYPVRNIRWPLSLLSYIVPARYFVACTRNSFVRGCDAVSQLYIPLALLAFAILVFAMAGRALRRMQLSD